MWSGDGTTLFYRSGDRMMAADIMTKPAFRSGPPVEVWNRPYFSLGMFGVHNYDVAGDGRFLMLRVRDDAAPTAARLNIVLNWLEELQARGVIR